MEIETVMLHEDLKRIDDVGGEQDCEGRDKRKIQGKSSENNI